MPKITIRSIIVLFVILGFTATPVLGYQSKALSAGTGSGDGSQAEPLFTSFPFRPADQPPNPDGVQRLLADTDDTAIISYNRATGVASFIRLPQAAPLPSALSQSTPVTVAATGFLSRYGSAFGIKNPETELRYEGSFTDGSGMTHLTYQQVYGGVEVFAGVLRVHVGRNNTLTAINGTFIPKLAVRTAPDLTADEAAEIAVKAVTAQQGLRSNVPAELVAAGSKLYVFRAGLAKGVPGITHLAYEVEVTNATVTVREFVYVDAHTGEVVDQVTGIHVAKDRQTYDANFDSAAGPGSVLCRGEGDPPVGDQACDEAHDYAGDTYDYFFNAFGRDSLDDAGMSMISYVNVCPGGICPWYNASWNGQFMSYGTTPTGRPWTGDDTVAHEFGHGITDFTSNLIYQWQSGAINEAMSDIYGETVDALNGAGLDSPDLPRIDYPINSTDVFPDGACVAPYGQSDTYPYTNVRWLQGEEDYLIRDMWAPSCMGDPDHVTHPNYHCATTDNGGVHINSGVVNHHFALLVDGGTFNGQTITGMGFTKAGAIYYQAQTNYLTPASNFADLDNALSASCTDLIGATLNDPVTGAPSAEVISAADCVEVDQASLAVELSVDPSAQCDFEPMLDPDAPSLCEGVGSVETISLTDWESGLGSWTVGTRDVANPATFDTADWAVVSALPDGRSGSAAFVADDPTLGNCADDTEAGVLFLESPPIVLPATATVPRVAFDHWVATELGWDGGNLKVSTNGGPWTIVPGSAFDFNSYPGSLNGGGNDDPLAGEEAFTGTNEGSVNGSWGQSQVNLLGLAAPGDTVQLRLEMGLDGCNGVIGWYVDDVHVYSCTEEEGPVCGDGVLDVTETCDDGNTADGDGCSATCQVEDGWTCADPVTDVGNLTLEEDFEGGAVPPAGWTAQIQNPSYTWQLHTTNPNNGSFAAEVLYDPALVPQDEWLISPAFTPAADSVLKYATNGSLHWCRDSFDNCDVEVWLVVGAVGDGDDIFVGLADDFWPSSYVWADAMVDLAPLLPGGPVQLAYRYVGLDGAQAVIDDIMVGQTVSAPSVCTPIVEDLVCNGGAVAFEGGIPSSWLVVDNAGTGMVWTDIAGSGELGNYTGGSGEAATASSDAFGPADFDTELRSSTFSLVGAVSASLDYLVNYQNYAALDFLDVDISADGGATWTTLLSWNEDHGSFRSPPGEAVSIDLSAFLGMQNLMLRWHYYDPNDVDWDWYAQIDNVSLSCDLRGSITVVKQVNGPDAIEDWSFSGDLGDFSLPAAGGQQSFNDIPIGPYTISELPQFAYGAEVTCSNGATGTDSVTVDLQPGEDLTCTFANTLQVCDSILDDFNRYPYSDGYANIGPDWRGATSLGSYRIVADEVQVQAGGPIYWKPQTYGHDQEACVTLTKVDRKGHHSVLLKTQGDRPDWKRGVIGVGYDSKLRHVIIENYVRGKGWVTLAAAPMQLTDGDILTGQALHDGTVRAFVNGVLVLEASADPLFVDNGGSIGLWFFSWRNGHPILDNFGGK